MLDLPPRPSARRLLRRARVAAAAPLAAGAARMRRLSSDAQAESGFMLIEVIVSALLVALIVVATLNGFDGASKGAADERWQSEAELLAAQSQEQLRTDSADALDALESNPHVYTQEVNGTKFTITQEAKAVNAKSTGTGCSGSEASKENGANIEISSSVTWPVLAAAKRPAVKDVSIITPPTGSALEIDVTNGGLTPVSGVTAIATFLPSSGGGYQRAEGTTGAAGCIDLTGIDATSATVEIPEVPGYVTTAGKLKYPTQEVSIAPNITTPDHVTYAKGGRITAQFEWKGSTKPEWEGKTHTVKGDTFVVANNQIPSGETDWEVGSTSFEYESGGEEQYKALTGSYAETATTAAAAKYTYGNLFPFEQPWTVYAGDCPANKVGTEAEATGGATVKQGEATVIKVPMSRTELTIYTGSSSSSRGSTEGEHLGPVKITNTGCKNYETPLNATGLAWVHEQSQTSTEGHLENPFQPFGAYTLCMVDKGLKKTYTISGTNSTAEGTKPEIFLGQRTEAEWATLRSEEESKYKAAKTEYEDFEAKYKEYEAKYKEYEAKYKGYSTEYKEYEAKYKENETKYKEYEPKYKEYKTEYEKYKTEYEKDKTEYSTDKTDYEKYKTEYSTNKTEYEKYKTKYTETKKAEYKTKYEEYEKKYKEDETKYKEYETKYKEYETKYKTAETKYKEYEPKYKEYETKYKEAKTAYETDKADYETDKTDYEKDKTESEKDKTEYEKDKTEYGIAKTEYEKALAAKEKREKEESEAKATGVTVEAGESC